jgi:hypothetical protein
MTSQFDFTLASDDAERQNLLAANWRCDGRSTAGDNPVFEIWEVAFIN